MITRRKAHDLSENNWVDIDDVARLDLFWGPCRCILLCFMFKPGFKTSWRNEETLPSAFDWVQTLIGLKLGQAWCQIDVRMLKFLSLRIVGKTSPHKRRVDHTKVFANGNDAILHARAVRAVRIPAPLRMMHPSGTVCFEKLESLVMCVLGKGFKLYLAGLNHIGTSSDA